MATDGERVSVTFNGLTLGIFAGDLRFTAYKGSNLLRQEAIAKTQEPSVAYIYKAGLKGFAINDDTKLVWRDTAQPGRSSSFGGAPNQEPVEPAGAQPPGDSGCGRGLAGRLSAAAQVLLRARE